MLIIGREQAGRPAAPGTTGHERAGAPSARWPEDYPRMAPGEQLAAFLAKARADAPTPEGGRRTRAVPVEEMAEHLGVSPATYLRLAAGDAPWSLERVNAAAEVLDLGRAQRQVLATMTLGCDRLELLGVPEVGAALRMLVDAIPALAMVIDPCTKVLYRNAALASGFPRLAIGASVAHLLLRDTAVRAELENWRGCWAAKIIDTLIAAQLEAHPDWVEAIAREVEAVRAQNPEVEEIWRAREAAAPVSELPQCT